MPTRSRSERLALSVSEGEILSCPALDAVSAPNAGQFSDLADCSGLVYQNLLCSYGIPTRSWGAVYVPNI